MPKDHSLHYVDLHPQDLESQHTASDKESLILWAILWIMLLAILGVLAAIATKLNLFY